MILANQSLTYFDLDPSANVDAQDVTFLVTNILGTVPGDLNLDGIADGTDFGIWNEHRFTGCGSWSRGDFNGDGVTDVSDFNIWNAHKFQAAAAAASTTDDEVSPTPRTPRAPLTISAIPLAPWLVDVVSQQHAQDVPTPQARSMSSNRAQSGSVELPRMQQVWRHGEMLARRRVDLGRDGKQNSWEAGQMLERQLSVDAVFAHDEGLLENSDHWQSAEPVV